MAAKRKTTKKKTTKRKVAAKRPAAKKGTAAKRPAKRKTTTKKKATAKSKSKKTSAKTAVKTVAPKKVEKKWVPTPPKKPVLVQPKNKGSKQYTQSELFDCMCGFIGFTNRRQAREFYESFASMIQNSLKSGYRVVLPGLGKIQVKRTKARMGRNPMTQEAIRIPAKRKVAFTANKALKDAVL